MKMGNQFRIHSFLLLFTVFGEKVLQNNDKQSIIGNPGSEIKLLSWNVYGINDSPLQQQRATEIGKRLKDYDIVLLQEAWCMNVQIPNEYGQKLSFNSYDMFSNHLYQEATNNKMNFWLDVNKDALTRKGTDAGLGILSKYAINPIESIVFTDSCEQDELANKGVAYVQIKVSAHYTVHVFATHTQAQYNIPSPGVAAVQNKQTAQIKKFLSDMSTKHKFSLETDHVIIAGDFNVNKEMVYNAYQQLESLNLKPMWDVRDNFNKDKCPNKEFSGLMVWARTPQTDSLTSNGELSYSPQQQKKGSTDNKDFETTFGTNCFTTDWWDLNVEIKRGEPSCFQESAPANCPCCACTKTQCLEFASWDLLFHSKALEKTMIVKVDRKVAKWNEQIPKSNENDEHIQRTLSDHWPLVATWKIPETSSSSALPTTILILILISQVGF